MWMNTSSSRGSTSRHSRPSPTARDRRLQRGAIHAGDMQRAAEHPRRLDAGRAAQPAGGGVDPLAGRLEGDEAGAADDRGRAALHDDAPLREIDDAAAALRLVHVMGRDQGRQAVDRHVVDEVPELAPRLDVDAGGRLVEQQQLRLVQHAGGERQALLPAAGELAGELIAAVAQAHALDHPGHRRAAVGHFEHARRRSRGSRTPSGRRRG